MSIVYSSFRGGTREDKGALQLQNQNESGGLKSLVGKPASWARNALSWVGKAPSRAVDSYHQWRSHPVLQGSYIDGDPNITSYEVIYRSEIARCSMAPYRFKFHDPAHIITGIACQPKDAKSSSPEAEVVSGGVGCKEVEIVLTPVQEGDWCCVVQIVGIAENHLEKNSTPSQLTM
jgi:hypothetical protein